jgi:hypothetical protein
MLCISVADPDPVGLGSGLFYWDSDLDTQDQIRILAFINV